MIFRKVTVPYPVPVPSPSVSYSAPVVVGHGLYSHGLYGSSYGSSYGSYGSYGSSYSSPSYSSPWYPSSSVKIISPAYKSYGGYGGSYHGGLSFHGGGLGLSIGSKYGWPLKFGLKYGHWKK